jgi:excisionase family DNA binding protein
MKTNIIPPTPELETLFTAAELAQRWKVTTMTLRRWRSAGKLPVVRVGERRVLFRLCDVQRIEAAGFIA